jgi:hypothetical protein
VSGFFTVNGFVQGWPELNEFLNSCAIEEADATGRLSEYFTF